MNLPSLVLTAGCTLATVVGQQPTLDNHRHRLPGGQGPAVACCTADLDGDGLQDLVRASRFAFGVFLQDAGGRFEPTTVGYQPPPGATVPPEIVSIEVGRIVNGKLPDLVVGYVHGALQVYPNNGGQFGRPINLPPLPIVRPSIEQLLTGDLDGDGRDDIVVLANLELPVVYFARANYPQARPAFGPRLSMPRGVLADLDRDQVLDLLVVTANPGSPAVPSVYQNTRGVLAIISAFGSATLAAGKVLAVDLDLDGAPEVLCSPVGRAASVPVFRNISATPGKPNYAALASTGSFVVTAPRDLEVADLDGDGYADLLAIASNGVLEYGLSAGPTNPASFGPAVRLLDAAPRSQLCAVDLEGDGDLDLLVAGAGIEDALLLGAPPRTKIAAVDTEATEMPNATVADHLLVVTDVTGEGDPDLVMWQASGSAAGTPTVMRNVDGQARFEPVNAVGLVPALPQGSYRSVHQASVRVGGERDLLVAGRISANNPTGMRTLIRATNGTLVDDTASRWLVPQVFDSMVAADLSGAVAGSIGTHGLSDVVGIDPSGNPLVVFNRRGYYDRSGVLSATPSPPTSKVYVEDLDLDRRLDIVIVQPSGASRVFMASPAQPDRYVESRIGQFGSSALCRDLTGDMVPDILMSQQLSGGTFRLAFLLGLGNGTFQDNSALFLPNFPPLTHAVDEMVKVGGDAIRQHTVVLGCAADFDQFIVASKGVFAPPQRLSIHGSQNTAGLHVADLDLDGDPDVVVQRSDSWPALLFGQHTDFAHVGLGQAGRAAVIQVVMPDLSTVGGLGIGWPTTRVLVPSLGVLRLARVPFIWPISAATGRQQTIRIPLPSTLGLVPIPMQLFTVGSGGLRLRNLDVFQATLR